MIKIISVLLSYTLCLLAGADYSTEKKEFLKTPVFKSIIEKRNIGNEWKHHDENLDYKTGSQRQLPMTSSKKVPKTRGTPKNTEPSASLSAVRSTTVSVPPPEYATLPLPPVNSGSVECGFTTYTKRFCLYPKAKPAPLICADRWNRCLESYRP